MELIEIHRDIFAYTIKHSLCSCENLHSFVLTGNQINHLPHDIIEDFTINMQSILSNYANVMRNAYNDKGLDKEDCGKMFIYVFDRAFEVAYKLMMGKDVDTQFITSESFNYYELDVPEYIQLKIK